MYVGSQYDLEDQRADYLPQFLVILDRSAPSQFELVLS